MNPIPSLKAFPVSRYKVSVEGSLSNPRSFLRRGNGVLINGLTEEQVRQALTLSQTKINDFTLITITAVDVRRRLQPSTPGKVRDRAAFFHRGSILPRTGGADPCPSRWHTPTCPKHFHRPHRRMPGRGWAAWEVAR